MFYNRRFTEEVHPVVGLAPVANGLNTSQSTQAVNMRDFDKCVFIWFAGVGATGTATIIVEACSAAAGTNNTAIPFTYRSYAQQGTNDLPTTDPTLATSSGFTTTAGTNNLYVIEVDQGGLVALGYSYVRLTWTQVVNSAVLGGVLILLCNPTYQGKQAPRSVIV